MGDCNGRGAFTHTAYNDFEIIAANLLDGDDRRLSQRVPGYALYIDPPLGRVGLTEAQARQTGRPLLVSKRPMSRVGRAVERGQTQGFMKLVADAETHRILGAAILGVSGDEAIHGVLDLMSADQPFEALRWAVPIHPDGVGAVADGGRSTWPRRIESRRRGRRLSAAAYPARRAGRRHPARCDPVHAGPARCRNCAASAAPAPRARAAAADRHAPARGRGRPRHAAPR